MASDELLPMSERMYTYQDIGAQRRYAPRSQFWPRAEEFYGPWRIGSVGPERKFAHGFTSSAQLQYDPTNGTVSLGNIWRSAKHAEPEMPPIPAMLGEH